MAATFILKLGPVDLSSFLRVNPDDKMDVQGAPWIEPAFTETPFADGQPLISTTVHNREQMLPLYLKDTTRLKDALHALIQLIQNAANQRPLLLEWRDDGASASTFYDCQFVRFEPDWNFRRSQHGYAAGILRVWTSGYGHTGTTRICATAAGQGIFLSVPIASVGGDAPALLDTTIIAGNTVPPLGRIIALAPIINPSYTVRFAPSMLADRQPGALLTNDSTADASSYLALPVSPTGGASGVACRVPLPNPTIAGGDNRILAVVRSGIDAGVGINALDPYGNAMGATAVASMSAGWGLVDLGVCRLPTTGYPTQPKISILAGALWASGQAGPLILASPGGLQINEVFCLPDKNLTLILESGVAGGGASTLSKDRFARNALLNNVNDDIGNRWSAAWNNGHAASPNLLLAGGNQLTNVAAASSVDSSHLAGILTDSMTLSVKPLLTGSGDVRVVKESATGVYVQGRLAFVTTTTGYLDLAAATNTALNTLASVGLSGLVIGQKYLLAMQTQGNRGYVSLSRDDGGPVNGAAYASVGVANNAAVGGAGVPGLVLSRASYSPYAYSWEVDTIPLNPGAMQAFDSYRIDGPNADSYRTSSAGVFAGQKLVGVQRGAFPKMQPSTTSLAVIVAPFDQGNANDPISAVVKILERFTYSR